MQNVRGFKMSAFTISFSVSINKSLPPILEYFFNPSDIDFVQPIMYTIESALDYNAVLFALHSALRCYVFLRDNIYIKNKIKKNANGTLK